MARLVQRDRKDVVTQITTLYNREELLEMRNMSNLKQMAYYIMVPNSDSHKEKSESCSGLGLTKTGQPEHVDLYLFSFIALSALHYAAAHDWLAG